MRRPALKEITIIAKLTHTREQAALAKISTAALRLEKATQAVAQLLAITHEARTAAEAELVSKWLIWKQDELKARNVELAAARAEYQKTVQQSGRLIAEHAVVAEILEQTKKKELKDREACELAVTFPDGQSR